MGMKDEGSQNAQNSRQLSAWDDKYTFINMINIMNTAVCYV